MLNRSEVPAFNFRLRFFSERVFGVLVDGVVKSYNHRAGTVTLEAYFHGKTWKAVRSMRTEFYYPRGHENQGEPFYFTI